MSDGITETGFQGIAKLIEHRAQVIADAPASSDPAWLIDRYRKLGEAVYAFARKVERYDV